MAVRLAQPSCVREIQQGAIAKDASEVLPPDECCELILNLRAPKTAWRTLSEVYTLRGLEYTATTGLPFARPICPERAFQQCWQDLLAPLELPPPPPPGEHFGTQGHGHQLAVGIMAALHC